MGVRSADPTDMLAEIERLTEELAESEARFRNIIERNADAIVVVDHEGAIRFVNGQAAALFEAPSASMLGSTFGFPLVAGETTELDLLRAGEPVVVEMRVVETQWHGEPACIASLRDVTERKRIEQRARDLIRAESARAAAEKVARKFRFLAESTSLLSSSLDYAATLAQVAQLCVARIADWVVVYTLEDDKLQRLEVAHRDPAKAALIGELHSFPIEEDESNPVAKLVTTRQPHLSARVDWSELAAQLREPRHIEVIAELGIASFMLVPMIARQRVLGAIALVRSDDTEAFDEEDLALATELASRAALAIDNARLYAEARQANQIKSELLAMISHDLRTPLNSIIGYGQLLQLGIPETLSDATNERVTRMLASAKHQLYLIDELLHFARLDAKHVELRLEDVHLQQLVRDAVTLMEPLAQERGLALDMRAPESPLVFKTDPDKLRQVLLNLLANAVKYTEEGGVTVELAGERKDVEIRIRDTGIGITPEHLPHVFEPFWQADRSQRARGGGTGLGLNVVQQIVQMLGGRVTAESEPGRGSTFTVRLQRRA